MALCFPSLKVIASKCVCTHTRKRIPQAGKWQVQSVLYAQAVSSAGSVWYVGSFNQLMLQWTTTVSSLCNIVLAILHQAMQSVGSAECYIQNRTELCQLYRRQSIHSCVNQLDHPPQYHSFKLCCKILLLLNVANSNKYIDILLSQPYLQLLN